MYGSSPPASFTQRELEILQLLAYGLSNREIALKLTLSLDTVKWHNKQIFGKLSVTNRTQAAARAQDLGLLAADQASTPAIRVHHNLPAQVTTFVGRQHEVREVYRLLDTARLLTLTGPGGIGKTRLALQMGTSVLSRFVDGVYFVPCAAVGAADNVLWAIAESLDFQFRKSGEPRDQLLDFFEDKRLLLILDNFEHLVGRADLLTDILKHASHTKILITSRERLRLYGEVVLTLQGLTLPASDRAEDLRQSESVQLFVQRAHAANPGLILESADLRHIARICRLVEGMPLGIELAASWVDTLTPAEIGHEIEHSLDILASELRDVPTSQHSIRAVFERSWNLLSDQQQMAFQKLAVFQGGFTREAAEAITGVNLLTLHLLVSKSLLRHDPQSGRYEQHELLRHYAAEELADSGEFESIRHAHASYFADFMADHWLRMRGSNQQEALLAIEANIDNARAAWHYWIEQQAVDQIYKFLNAFWIIYDIKGWYPAGVELFQQGIAVMEAVATPEAAAGLGWLMAVQGLYQVVNGYEREGFVQARAGFEKARQGVDLLRAQQRPDMMIIPLISAVIAACHFNEAHVAHQAAQECLDVALAIHDDWGAAKAWQFLAMMALDEDRYDDARQLALDALRAFVASGDRWSKSILCIEVLGLLETVTRDLDAARQWIQRGLDTAEEVDFAYSRQMAYWQFGYVEVLQQHYGAAAQYWQMAQNIGDRIFGLKSIIGFSCSSNAGEWGGRKLISA
jgi:predicted ATPase/DNA-binding CsgD family transcriptional regulator